MGETAEERARRLARMVINSTYGNIGGGSEFWYDADRIVAVHRQISEEMTNPCAEITIASSQRCTLGYNPLVKFTKFKFNF